MDSLIDVPHPKHKRTIRPGRVGTLGETIVIPRFRQSTPTMPWAYDPYYAGKRAEKLGSNVQDGDTVGFDNKGGPARVRQHGWVGNRSFKHQYGRTFIDLVQPDKRYTPWVSSIGDFTWRNKLATVRKLKRGNKFFSIIPGPYEPEPGDLSRGGSTPRTTVIGEEEGLPTNTDVVTGTTGYPLPQLGPANIGQSRPGTNGVSTNSNSAPKVSVRMR